MATGVIRKKTEKKGKAKFAEKGAKAAAPSTALAKVGEVIEVEVAEHFSAKFIRDAQRLDEKIIKTVDTVERNFVALGEMFEEMSSKGYHRAFRNEEGGPLYPRFEHYLRARWPRESPTQIQQAMRIVRGLTMGDNPTVSRDDVLEMTRNNAEGLVKLKDAGMKITPKLIERAKTTPIKVFQAEVEATLPAEAQRKKASRGEQLATEPEVFVRRSFTLSGQVASNLAKAIEIARYLTRSAENSRENFDDRVISAIVGEFLSMYEKEYNEVMAAENAKAMHNAQMTEDSYGPSVEEENDGVESVVEPNDDPAEETEAPAKTYNAPGQCSGLKDDGSPCGIPAKNGSDLCWFHLKKKAEAAAA